MRRAQPFQASRRRRLSSTSWVAAKVGNQRWLDATMWRQMMSRRAAPMVGGAMGLILLGCFLGCCCLGLICCARSRHLRAHLGRAGLHLAP